MKFSFAGSCLCCLLFASTLCAQSVVGAPMTSKKNAKLETKMPNDKVPTGTWQGSLAVGNGMTLPLVFHFAEVESGLTGSLDSPAQNQFGIKFDTITMRANGTLFAAIEKLHAHFEGRFESTKLTGTWNQSGSSLPLTLSHTAGYHAPKRLQEPQAPFPYDSEQVSFKNGDVEISGTLTLPIDAKSCPVVVLLHGSGPHDRDETIFFHKPFLVLADYLTKRGIGVLRYDKRGCNKSTGDYKKSTSNDFADDGLAAINFLKTDARIDPTKIGLLGHSEGGILAPIIASKSTDVSFIVMMAGTALPGDEILIGQVKKLGEGGGLSAQRIDLECRLARETYAILKAEPDDKLAIEKIKAMRHRLNPTGEPTAPDKNFDSQLTALTSPWYRYFIAYDPRPTLSKVQCPVLAINGDHDTQVPATENLDAISKAFESSGNKKLTIVKLAGLNHLFQTCSTGLPQEYATIEETISPKALAIIGDWIAKQTEKSNDRTQ